MSTERTDDPPEPEHDGPDVDHHRGEASLSDRPGTPGFPSRAESREGAEAANTPDAEAPEPLTVTSSGLEGRRDHVVEDPDRPGRQITDIDRIEDGILWEEKSATSAVDIDRWVSKHINKKFESYLEARQHLKGYENAPIGFRFSRPSADPEFRSAVDNAVGELQKTYPDVAIRLEWPE